MTLNVTHLCGFMAGNIPPASIVYQSEASNESNLTTYTFSTQGIGTAAAGRRVFVGVVAPANGNFGTISSVTIDSGGGDVSCTQILQIEDASGFSNFAVYGLQVDTATTATIKVNLSAAPDRLGIMVFSAYDLLSMTPTDTDSDNTASTNLSKTLDVQSGGVMLAIAGCENTSPTWTWTNLTERHDGTTGGGGGTKTGASDNFSSGQSVTITAAPSAAQSRQGAIFLSFR